MIGKRYRLGCTVSSALNRHGKWTQEPVKSLLPFSVGPGMEGGRRSFPRMDDRQDTKRPGL